jgi:RNA polymerase sigma-70 factor (ECF subfamily)
MTHPQQEIVPLLPEMRGFARSLAGGDAHFADDLVQDAVLLALRSWDSFTPGTNLKSWLLKIVHNRFHSLKRRSWVKAEIGCDNLEGLSWLPPSQEQSIELSAFKRAFAALKAEHRTALVLVGVHGLPYEEIAKVCGCEVGTVKSRVNRARSLLRRMLLDDHERRPAAPEPVRPAKRAPPVRTTSAAVPPPPMAATVAVPVAPPSPPPSPILRQIADSDRLIVRAETRLTCYRQIADHLGRARVNLDAGRNMLRLAEQHLAQLYRHRDSLLSLVAAGSCAQAAAVFYEDDASSLASPGSRLGPTPSSSPTMPLGTALTTTVR